MLKYMQLVFGNLLLSLPKNQITEYLRDTVTFSISKAAAVAEIFTVEERVADGRSCVALASIT